MSKSNPHKRTLKFDSVEDVMKEVRRLMENGYTSHGKWNLSQVLGHLNEWARFPMDGFPTPPLPIRMIFWVMGKTVGPRIKRKILANGFSDGMLTAPQTVPVPDALSDLEAAQQYQGTLDRLKNFSGDLHPSPLFGPLDRQMAIKVTLLHAEHHLGFLEPKT